MANALDTRTRQGGAAPGAQDRRLGVSRPWAAPAIWGGGAATLILAVVLFFAFIFQWNWLRGPLAHEISARLNRQVAITGDLSVRLWSWSPSATVSGLVIGEPGWAGKASMAVMPRLTVSVRLPDLLRGRLVLPLVAASSPQVRLLRTTDGRANWNFGPGGTGRPLQLPPIQHLVIEHGRVTVDDQGRGLRFDGVVSSNEGVNGSQHGPLGLAGQGALRGFPFGAVVTGGPMLNIGPDRPYPFVAHIQSGATRVEAFGVIPHPFDLNRFSARIHLTGEDLSQLYHLTGLALPATPPYDLRAGFARAGHNVALRHLRGRFGDSDLAGSVSVHETSGRPFLTADLVSRRLKFGDLAPVIGGAPRAFAGGRLSPAQAALAAKLKAEQRLLPDTRLPLGRVRSTDARITYRAETVESGPIPVQRLSLTVNLDHGLLVVNPLAMTLPQGALTGEVRIDARQAIPRETLDLKLAGARIEELMAHGKANPPMEGAFQARARLSGAGDSVRAAAANSGGEVTLVIPHGAIRQSLAELMGVDVTKSLFMLLTKNQRETGLRCAVVDLQGRDGVLAVRQMVLDTDVVAATGSGEVNLKDETVNLRLSGKPKKFRLVRVAAPITMSGRLAQPKFGVDLAAAAPQVGVAVALGALVTPLAAILPFVSPGLAHDADCGALLAQASARGAPVRAR